MYYQRVVIVDGETEKTVSFVGVHPLRWANPLVGDPDVAFEKLLRKIRDELAKDPVIWAAELINEIDALLGDEANGDQDT